MADGTLFSPPFCSIQCSWTRWVRVYYKYTLDSGLKHTKYCRVNKCRIFSDLKSKLEFICKSNLKTRTESTFLYSNNSKIIFVFYGHNRNVVSHYAYVWHDNYTTNMNIVQANHIQAVHADGMCILFYRHVHIFGNYMRICSHHRRLEQKFKKKMLIKWCITELWNLYSQ